MKCAALLLLTLSSAFAQPWSAFLDPSRAIDWTTVPGWTIPVYSVNCSTQPSLSAGSGNASANTTSIQNALNSCDSTHNVVLIPSGTYYVAGIQFGTQGKQVLRGAGPNSTTLIVTAESGSCVSGGGICMQGANATYANNSNTLPPSGAAQCTWTAGYSQGTTSITLSSCGGTPTANTLVQLDQANDTSDTSGVYICDSATSDCTYGTGEHVGREISGAYYGLAETHLITGVTGTGPYTVTISPGLMSTNYRSGQNPGAWFPGYTINEGLENITIDASSGSVADGALSQVSCYQCWVKNVRFLTCSRNCIWGFNSLAGIIRDSYFYGAQSSHTQSYTIELQGGSGYLIENNITQQVTTPFLISGSSLGNVYAYNFAINNFYNPTGSDTYTWPIFPAHQEGADFNLFEGNNVYALNADNTWGPSDQVTVFRNLLTGFQPNATITSTTIPVLLAALERNWNFAGNVMGQPSYHTQYQTYATSTTTGTGGSSLTTSIYALGWGGTGGGAVCSNTPNQSTLCDPLTFSLAMRWGNWDTVNAATQWNSTEAAPASNTYVNANFTTSYFNTLAQTLPASLVHSSKPSWWPSGKNWPPMGPDVSTGNIGICSGGTYNKYQATASGQCSGGGSLTTAWASHATSIPAQDCYLNTMGGPQDGSGSVLSFDANSCYGTAYTGSAFSGSISGKIQ